MNFRDPTLLFHSQLPQFASLQAPPNIVRSAAPGVVSVPNFSSFSSVFAEHTTNIPTTHIHTQTNTCTEHLVPCPSCCGAFGAAWGGVQKQCRTHSKHTISLQQKGQFQDLSKILQSFCSKASKIWSKVSKIPSKESQRFIQRLWQTLAPISKVSESFVKGEVKGEIKGSQRNQISDRNYAETFGAGTKLCQSFDHWRVLWDWYCV